MTRHPRDENSFPPLTRLTPQELGELEAFLDSPDRADDVMSFPEMRGFVFGIAAAPILIPPSQWLDKVLGADDPFASVDDAKAVIGLLLKYFNHIAQTVQEDSADPTSVGLDVDEDVSLSAWSQGFTASAAMAKQGWQHVLETEDEEVNSAYTVSIAVLTVWSNEEAFRKILGVDDSEFERYLANSRRSIPDALTTIAVLGHQLYRRELARAHTPIRRKARPERNDPCPCGSGRKYKKCCMESGPSPVRPQDKN